MTITLVSVINNDDDSDGGDHSYYHYYRNNNEAVVDSDDNDEDNDYDRLWIIFAQRSCIQKTNKQTSKQTHTHTKTPSQLARLAVAVKIAATRPVGQSQINTRK